MPAPKKLAEQSLDEIMEASYETQCLAKGKNDPVLDTLLRVEALLYRMYVKTPQEDEKGEES